ncbi:MAG: hypothetical protein AB1861_01890 [Cyanobacteriota bacterium]
MTFQTSSNSTTYLHRARYLTGAQPSPQHLSVIEVRQDEPENQQLPSVEPENLPPREITLPASSAIAERADASLERIHLAIASPLDRSIEEEAES